MTMTTMTTTNGTRDTNVSRVLGMFFFLSNFYIVTNDYLQIYYERLPLPTTTHDDNGAANCHNEDDSLRLLYGNLFFFFSFFLL